MSPIEVFRFDLSVTDDASDDADHNVTVAEVTVTANTVSAIGGNDPVGHYLFKRVSD